MAQLLEVNYIYKKTKQLILSLDINMKILFKFYTLQVRGHFVSHIDPLGFMNADLLDARKKGRPHDVVLRQHKIGKIGKYNLNIHISYFFKF